MAEVPVVLSGFYIDKYGRTGAPVTVAGMLSIAGLHVGGGPMPPGEAPPPSGGGGPVDPGWGVPERPVDPGYFPPRPTHPIYPGETPRPPKPPEPIQPPIEWKAIWHPTEGWMVVGVPNVPHPAPSASPPPAA